jgi:uncharacterized membrane protein YvbJ
MNCPKCNAEMEAGERFCGSCGYDLRSVEAAPLKMQPCPSCGTPVNPGERFCGECGQQVVAHTAPSELTEQSVARSSDVITTLLGTALFIFFIVLGISFFIAIVATVKELF